MDDKNVVLDAVAAPQVVAETWDFSSMDRRAENAKFTQARKKYAKRRVAENKKDGGTATASDATCELFPETYPLA